MMFYSKEVEVYKLTPFEDEWGVTHEDRYMYVKSMMVDIQPYSQEKLKREYGYDLETTLRMFSDVDESLKESVIIVYREQTYSIVKIVPWDLDDQEWGSYLDIALKDAIGVELHE